MLDKQKKRQMRHNKIRSKICGTNETPRLCVFRSNKYIYVQLIDDEKGKILISASDLSQKSGDKTKNAKSQNRKITEAFNVGKIAAQQAIEKNIKKVVFDRGGYKYHGRVKALADGARAGGLQF